MDMSTPMWSPTPFSPAGYRRRISFTIGNKGISRLGYKGTNAIVGPEANPGFGNHVRDFVLANVPSCEISLARRSGTRRPFSRHDGGRRPPRTHSGITLKR